MASRAPTCSIHAKVVDGIREVVLANLAKPPEVGQLAVDLGYSERQLRRILHEGGIRWRTWLTEQRMQRAAELLLNGRRVRQVAEKVGYRADGLAVPFVAYAGMRPTDARRAGQLRAQLTSLRRNPPRSADLYARCRAVDSWTRLWREAKALGLRARPDTPVSVALAEAAMCVPPPRPRPVPRGRHRERELSEQLSDLLAGRPRPVSGGAARRRPAPRARRAWPGES